MLALVQRKKSYVNSSIEKNRTQERSTQYRCRSQSQILVQIKTSSVDFCIEEDFRNQLCVVQMKTSEEASRIEKDFRDRFFFRGRLQMSSIVWRKTPEIDSRLSQVVKGIDPLRILFNNQKTIGKEEEKVEIRIKIYDKEERRGVCHCLPNRDVGQAFFNSRNLCCLVISDLL